MQINPIIKNPPNNKCKHCRIASICLPANLDKKILKEASLLNFHARILEPGQHLCRQGQMVDSVYALRSGIMKSYMSRSNGEEFVMDFHLPPEIFGWEGINPQQRAFSIVALDHCNVCEIPLDHLEKLLGSVPELTRPLMALFSQKIRNRNMALLRTTAEQRVANFILQLAIRYKKLGYPYYLCKLVMTYQDIANYLRIAPETISRTLKNMQTKNIIKVQRHKIYIDDFKRLQDLAQVTLDMHPETVET